MERWGKAWKTAEWARRKSEGIAKTGRCGLNVPEGWRNLKDGEGQNLERIWKGRGKLGETSGNLTRARMGHRTTRVGPLWRAAVSRVNGRRWKEAGPERRGLKRNSFNPEADWEGRGVQQFLLGYSLKWGVCSAADGAWAASGS